MTRLCCDKTGVMTPPKAHEPVQMTCLYFWSLLLSLPIKQKASKARKDMQGIHEGTGAMLLPVLLAATPPPPKLLCNCVSPRPSWAACTLFTVSCSLFSPFLYFIPDLLSICLIRTQSVDVYVPPPRAQCIGGGLSSSCSDSPQPHSVFRIKKYIHIKHKNKGLLIMHGPACNYRIKILTLKFTKYKIVISLHWHWLETKAFGFTFFKSINLKIISIKTNVCYIFNNKMSPPSGWEWWMLLKTFGDKYESMNLVFFYISGQEFEKTSSWKRFLKIYVM